MAAAQKAEQKALRSSGTMLRWTPRQRNSWEHYLEAAHPGTTVSRHAPLLLLAPQTSALRFDTRGDTTPASAGALPRRGGDGMDVLPSQMSDSQEGPGIHGTGNAGAGQALLCQTWPDPAERPRKPQPSSFHLSRSCQPHMHQDEGMCWKSRRGLANKETDSPPQLLMAATESTGETGQRK